MKVLNKEDERYLRKFKTVSMTRFKEIFHQINSSKHRKKVTFDTSPFEKKRKLFIIKEKGRK